MQRYPLRADLRVPYHEQPGQDGALATFDDVGRLVQDHGLEYVWDDLEHARRLRCAFCGQRQHEVARLIAGPTSYICDECIRLCAEILSDEQATRFDGRIQPESAAGLLRNTLARVVRRRVARSPALREGVLDVQFRE